MGHAARNPDFTNFASADAIIKKAAPLPQAAAQPTSAPVVLGFRRNPYTLDPSSMMLATLMAVECGNHTMQTAPRKLVPPAEVLLHPNLRDRVTFIPYPHGANGLPIGPTDACTFEAAAGTERLFVGQLPIGVSDELLSWVAYRFADRMRLVSVQHIHRTCGKFRNRISTGCAHLQVAGGDAPLLLELLNKKILFDEIGVWYAENPGQLDAMTAYAKHLRENPDCRPASSFWPYQPVNVELAKSTYVPNARDRLSRSYSVSPEPAFTPMPP